MKTYMIKKPYYSTRKIKYENLKHSFLRKYNLHSLVRIMNIYRLLSRVTILLLSLYSRKYYYFLNETSYFVYNYKLLMYCFDKLYCITYRLAQNYSVCEPYNLFHVLYHKNISFINSIIHKTKELIVGNLNIS